jgi:hypothetical protein
LAADAPLLQGRFFLGGGRRPLYTETIKMIGSLSWKDEPAWLSRLTAESIQNGRFPLRNILRNSLYYPASGFDGDPVKYLAGHIHSFIYVDYGQEEEAFERALHVPGFRGYRVLGKRAVAGKELIPRGWDLQSLPPWDRSPVEWPDAYGAPFCTWVVFERRPDIDDELGPSRFSLLYWWHEGVAAFQALYLSRRLAPKAVAIIQPGYGFGRNWTDFTEQDGVLARVVMNSPASQPRLLLFGGHSDEHNYLDPCWPGYGQCLGFLEKAGGGSIGVWERKTHQGHIQ